MYLSEVISERVMRATYTVLQRESAFERLCVHLVFKNHLFYMRRRERTL